MKLQKKNWIMTTVFLIIILLTCIAVLGFGIGKYFRSPLEIDADAVKHEPGNSMAHELYGYELLAAGRPVEAEGEYRMALALEPKFLSARFHVGKALAAQGRYKEAQKEWEIALKEAPPSWSRQIRSALDSLPLILNR